MAHSGDQPTCARTAGSCELVDPSPFEDSLLGELKLLKTSCDDTFLAGVRKRLTCRTVPELKAIAKRSRVKLTGVVRKADIVERLLNMAKMGLVSSDDVQDNANDLTNLPYLCEDVCLKLRRLPKFSDIDLWSKKVAGVLTEFTFMNLLVYLVYGRDKTFDMQAMRAFKSLKAYKFFADGFVKNVWLFNTESVDPRVVYVRGFVQHSLSMGNPLEVFVALDGDKGDVFSAQCNCVSG